MNFRYFLLILLTFKFGTCFTANKGEGTEVVENFLSEDNIKNAKVFKISNNMAVVISGNLGKAITVMIRDPKSDKWEKITTQSSIQGDNLKSLQDLLQDLLNLLQNYKI